MDSKTSLTFRLARFLRLNGEKVINGTCKLSLTTSALNTINSVFIDILVHDRVESSSSFENSLTQEFLEDAQFLLDFIRKTPFLKLFHGMQTLRGSIDLSYFKGLTALELRKIPAHLIVGLNTLSHLKALICNRSIGSLKELFGPCTEESRSGSLWSELKELNVSSNYLEGLDDSLEILPNIEILDTSHNSLKHLDELMVLDKLVVLNLNYNMLSHLPLLSTYSSFTLKVLLIRNNNLEDLAGLGNLINLEEFDVSYNCLSEYHVLKPLEKLKSLRSLHLENNPLSLYKQHREETAKYFHPEVVKRGVSFDGKTLSAKDILILRSHTSQKISQESGLGHQTSINVIVEDVENVITRSDHHYKTLRHSALTEKEDIPRNSSPAGKDSGSTPSSCSSENTDEDVFRHKTRNKKKFRKTAREVIILQPEEISDENVPDLEKDQERLIDVEIPSHILTKKLIETRRMEYGSEWLIPSHSFRTLVSDESVHTVPTDTPMPTSVNAGSPSQYQLKSTSDMSTEPVKPSITESHDSLLKENSISLANGKNRVLSQINMHVEERNSSEYGQSVRNPSVVSDDIQVLVSTSKDWTHQNLLIDSDANLCEPDVYEHSKQNQGSVSDVEDVFSDSEEENEDRIFVLERKEKEKSFPLFVSIGSKYMREKDFQTGKLTDFLDLTCLFSIKLNELSMEGVKYEISLAFDTLNASKQKRFYLFDDISSVKHMASILQPFADAKAFEDTALGALECLKCCSQFSKKVAHRKVLQKKKLPLEHDSLPSSYDSTKGYIEEADVCPNCGSTMVVEMETIPLPSMMLLSDKESSVKTQKHLTKSEAVKEVTVSVSASPPLGQISSMLFSMMKNPKTKKSPFSSCSKEKSNVKSCYENAGTDCIAAPLGLNENMAQGLEQAEFAAISEHRDLISTPKMRRNSSNVTLQSNPSQSSIAVISSDSDCDVPLDSIPERDSLCSPIPVLPLLSHDFEKNIILSSVKMYPAATSASSSSGSACTAGEEFCEPQSSEDYVACETKYGKNYSDNQSVERKSKVADEVSLTLSCNDSLGHISDREFQDCEDSFSCCEEEDSLLLDESTYLINLLSKKETMGYEKFSSIDHRLKLYLEFTIFGKDEELDACLEADIVQLSDDSEFKGFFVFSCKRIYVMKLVKEIDDDVAKCVQKLCSWPLNQLKVIKLLPGSQGFAATCGSDKIFLFLIQDSDCCNCFISCITDVIRHRLQGAHFPKFETSSAEAFDQIKKEVLSPFFPETADGEKDFEVMLYLLLFWCDGSSGQQELQRVALIIASNYFFVAKVSYPKQIHQKKQATENPLLQYEALMNQKISNLVEIQLRENLKEARLNFLDEQNMEYSWTVSVQTKSSLFALINTLKNPWETLFGINLPICLCKGEKAAVHSNR